MINSNITLPQRPLTIKRGVLSLPFVYYFSPPVLFALLIAMVFAEGPGIVRDFKISQAPFELSVGDITGHCTTKKMIFTTCEAKLSYVYDGVRHASEVEFMFVDFHPGDYEANIVISKADPALATLSIGLSMLWNRIFTFAMFALLLASGVVVLLLTMFRIIRSRSKIREPGMLTLIPVAITGTKSSRGRLTLTYADNVREHKTKRVAFTQFDNGSAPIIIGTSNSHDVALAVWHDGSSLPVLLDDQLERIDLRPEERAELMHALSAQGLRSEHGSKHPPVKSQSFAQSLKIFSAVILMTFVAICGYWLWYVFAAPSQFTSPAMEITNMMPKAINHWACSRLQQRFGHENAPFGCAADDFRSWK